MPSILSKHLASKILGSEWSFGYNCYEVGHTWTPSCTGAALEVSTAAAIKILPLYAMLYTFSQVAVQRKLDLNAAWDTTKSTLRSTFFIFFHAYNGSVMGCALRQTFGRFYYRVLVCLPALISSYLSLLIEKPSRRQALAFYLLNMASEIVFRMAVTKGYFKPIVHGETILFACSLAAWYHLLRTHGFGHDPVSGAVKVLIGRHEAQSRARTTTTTPTPREDLSLVDCNSQQQHRQNKFDEWLEWAGAKWFGGAHVSCPHTHAHASCFAYVLHPVPSRLALGYIIQAVLKLAGTDLRELFTRPMHATLAALTSTSCLRFGAFLATLVSSGRLTSCLLRRYSNASEFATTPVWHASVSGLCAGTSMLWAPRSSLSMYVMWKAVEQYYLLAVSRNKLSYFNATIATIYSLSAATILYTFALEPRFVRASYMKFLDNVSDHRLHQLNRMVLDVFGTGSSVGYEDYFPDLHPKYMSNQFKELVFNWMIQPYE